MWRLLYFIPLWLGYLILVKIPVNFVGLGVVPFLWKYRFTDYKDVLTLFVASGDVAAAQTGLQQACVDARICQ